MNARETRQYEMLLRVRDFGTANRHLFDEPGVALDAFAAVAAAVSELAAANLRTMAASASARAQRKAEARAAINEVLLKVNHTAKVLRARGMTLPAFALPSVRRDQTLLATARHFARDADALAAEFTAHQLPPKLIADTANAFEEALRDRGMSRADLTAARARTRELLARAFHAVRTLDVIIDNQLADDGVIQAVWKQARRIEDRRSRTVAAEPAAPPVEAAA